MPGAARLNDSVTGTTAGEHSGHSPPHSPETFSGEISAGCSGDVFINGRPAATVGSVTTERDGCCGSSQGAVAVGSSTVFINGRRHGSETPLPLTAGVGKSPPGAAMC